ncbi:unnamed protein product [Nezara viridula]|uniref:RNase NYN domain-containing protein n=1 Tax=Nezara viridula TaxID=85310 RepID=A0A9P0H9J8_NEZVI|nr:unnamed protein product [Nezara viridula]
MGTMDVITLDDTIDNDASLFIIDEEPILEPSATTVMKEVTNKQTSKRRKRKSDNKKMGKNKKINSDMKKKSKTQWLVLGPNKAQSSESIISRINSTNSSSTRTTSESRTSSEMDIYSISSSLLSSNKSKKSDLETIVIQSDEEDDMDVIELSDEEVGTIGGELSKSVHRAQGQLSAFQKRGGIITKAWPKSPQKKRSPPVANSSSKIQPGTSRNLRPIVIDGSNVAFGHGCRTGFSSKGLQICCDYFLNRGHTVKVFVPQFRRRHHATSDFHILDKLEKEKILVFTPSRKVEGKQVVSYDDRYIVEYATKCGGVIVSRDNYQDLLAENSEWKETINKRLLMFTWVDDMIMFPQDPLGRTGPSLEEFLSFPPETSKGDTKAASVTTK